MANTLNIPERTLAEVSASTNSINVIGLAAGNRPEALHTSIVRISDHADNVAAEVGSDTDKMAIFMSRAQGHPWTKDVGIKHIVVVADADPVANPTTDDVTVLFPNYDYSTFE